MLSAVTVLEMPCDGDDVENCCYGCDQPLFIMSVNLAISFLINRSVSQVS